MRERSCQTLLCKGNNNVESFIIHLVLPMRLQPALKGIVYSQTNGSGKMRGFADIIESVNQSLG